MHTVLDANRNTSGLHKSTSTYSAEESLTIHTASEQLQQSIWLNTSMSSITVIKDLNSIVISRLSFSVSLFSTHTFPWVTAEQNTLTSTPLTSRSPLKRTRALTCHCNWAGLSVGWFAAPSCSQETSIFSIHNNPLAPANAGCYETDRVELLSNTAQCM